MGVQIRFIGLNPSRKPFPPTREGYYLFKFPKGSQKETIKKILLEFGVDPSGIAVAKNGNIVDLNEEVEEGDRLDITIILLGG